MKVLSFLFSLLTVMYMSGCGGNHSVHHDEDDHDAISESDDEHGAHSHGETFSIPETTAQQFGIETIQIVPTDFSEIIKTSGMIEPSAGSVQSVSALISGIFTLSPGLSVGKTVNKGERIGYISSQGLEGGDVNAVAKANFEAAKKEFERISSLYEHHLVTIAEYNAAEKAYEEARAAVGPATSSGGMALIAPISGTIVSLPVVSGSFVDKGTQTALIATNATMTLRADLPSRYYSRVPEISSANFSPDGSQKIYSLHDLGGKFLTSSQNVSATNGYIPLYFSFMTNGEILPGSIVEIYLIGDNSSQKLVIPKEGLVEIQGNKYAYVMHHDDEYEKRLVKTGADDGLNYEILDGLKEGERVVIKGASAVRMAETSAIAPPAHNHEH